MRIQPITCYRPTPEAVAAFASPPYDVFDRAGAADYVREHPRSFLAIDRPETSFAPGRHMYAPEVYQRAGSLIRERGLDGTLLKDQVPCLYLYRLEQGGRRQVGVVCACSVAEYENGTIHRHEETRPEKTADRTEHIRATGAQTGPVFLAYRDSMAIDVIVDAARMSEALYDFTDEQGVRQTVWRIARSAAVEALAVAFSTVPCAYIADGHHRASAAAAYCHERREGGGGGGEHAADSFLAVLFPASQLTVLPYNRLVHDNNGLAPEQLLAALAQADFVVGEPQQTAVEPAERRHFGLYAHGSWYPLRYVGEVPDVRQDPAAALDVALLQDRVLGPVLGIDDPRTSDRISFVGGIEGGNGLERRAGRHGIAFTLHPTSVEEIMTVSDAGLLMPPKSTWFEPKLRSGLFIRRV